MPQLVVLGAKAACSNGTTPATLVALPRGMPVQSGSKVAATVMDHAPIANLATFGLCNLPANPAVAAATSAAAGVLTPAPCIPATSAPWTPGATKTTINGKAALTSADTCNCSYGGVITITDPGQTTVSTS